MGLVNRPEDRDYRELDLDAPDGVCHVCGKSLHVTQWRERSVETLDGLLVLTMRDRRCSDKTKTCPGRAVIHRHPGELSFALPGDQCGLDLLMRIGEWRLDLHCSLDDIHARLDALGVRISPRTVGNAFQRFLALTRCIDGESPETIAELRAQGGILLGVDGVQFDDSSPVLYVLTDLLSRRVLFASREPRRDAKSLAKLLRRVKALGVPVRGIVSDKEKGLVPAIRKVFADVPHQYCQLHFIGQCSKPLDKPLAALSKEIDKVGRAVRALRREFSVLPPAMDADELAEREMAGNLLELAHAATKKRSGRAPFAPGALQRHDAVAEVLDYARETKRSRRRKKGASAGR